MDTVLTIDRATGELTLQPVSKLQRRTTEVDNANEITRTVEYCWLVCPGPAHASGMADTPSHFCDLHIHRSGTVQLKDQLLANGAVGEFL